MSWLSGYQYRKLITISGSAGAGSGYQVLLKVGESANAVDADFHLEGHALNFPNDIRFTAADGVTELAHWLEKVEGVAPDRTAYFWVKVEDSLDVDVQIYCYYGQEGGASASDPEATFDWYDDFSTDTLSSYTVHYGDWSISDGVLQSSNTTKAVIQINKSFPANVMVVARMSVSLDKGNYGIAIRFDFASDSGYYTKLSYNNSILISKITSGDVTNLTSASFTTNANTWYEGITKVSGNRIEFTVDSTTITTTDDTYSTGDVGFYHASGAYSKIMYVDYVRVQRYILPEPAFSSAGAEETAVVYVSSSLSDSYNLFNFTSKSASEIYAILNFARNLVSDSYKIFNFAANLASDQYKLLALLEKLLSDVYSIRTFTSRTLPDSYAIISGIAVREVIVLRSKITREMNLTSRVIREVLLRSKLN